MGGYADRLDVADGSLDELEANILWLREDGGGEVIWVSLDVLAVARPVRKLIVQHVGAATGVPADNIMVAASHTHSGPQGWHGEIHPVLPAELDPALCAALGERVRRAAERLPTTLAPAVISWSEGQVEGVGSNRHDPAGQHDQSVGVLVVHSMEDERPLALLYDYACHPTILGPEQLSWSADWVGAARTRIRHELRGPRSDLPVVFLQGCAGDVSARFHRRSRTPAEVERLGSIVGAEVALASRQATGVTHHPISVSQQAVQFPVRLGSATNLARTPAREGVSARAESDDTAVQARLRGAHREAEEARAAMASARLPRQLEMPVSLVQVGQHRWLHLPVELSANYGSYIRQAERQVRVVGYSDDYCGYVVEPSSHGAGRYEAAASYLDAAASQEFVTWCRRYVERS